MYVSLSAKVRSTHVVMKCKVQRFDQSRQVLSSLWELARDLGFCTRCQSSTRNQSGVSVTTYP